ncbi:FtsX-like permease family protein [Mucilaginibacter sp. PAMB04168]|uniref:ABC transporter permease n=1 Tax=Mucilaginibacter sp. PAMB04168 TaxID=3138567 RepID=UPI0031F65B5D
MLNNYFKTALRSLLKHKVFTIINIVGLAIGIGAALVIALVVQFDFSFDKFEPDGSRIYRVVSTYTYQGQTSFNSGVPVPLHRVMGSVSGLERAVPFRIYGQDQRIVVPAPNTAPGIFKNQENIIFCDRAYFEMLPYKWLAGSVATALQNPNRIVLTESRAKLYFPDLKPEQVLEKTVIYDDSLKMTVSGVVADLKENTDFNFHDFMSLATAANFKLRPSGGDTDGGYNETSWSSTSSYNQLFIKISKQSSARQTEAQLNTMLKNNLEKSSPGESQTLSLQPLSNLHFSSEYDNFDQRVVNKSVLHSLLGVAAFLLILACINFINLTTAQSSQRAREIGVRKTIGGTRQQLISQFLTETFLLTLIAAIISIGMAYLLLIMFADFIPAGISYSMIFTPGMLLFIFILIIVVAVISGFYPAVVMSSYQPVQVLKSNPKTSKGVSFGLRRGLTVTQFVIAQVFIMATILVSNQIHYMLNKDLGFKKDAVMYIRTPYKYANSNLKQVYLNKIKSIPQVETISLGSDAPSSNNSHSTAFSYQDGKTERETDVELKYADDNYLNVYQLKLLAGRNLQPHDSTGAYIINQTYCKFLGFQNPKQAVGKLVKVNDKEVPIIGVVADFYQRSLQYAIKPAAICFSTNNRFTRTLHIALKSGANSSANWKNALIKMESSWQEVFPDDDFEYRFVDESTARFYKAEQNTGKLLKWATGLSVLISCLGLLGLALYTTNQRTKEIGIRKILGATITQIVTLLSADFIKLIFVAFSIAAPVAWYAMSHWLQNYAYHINPGIWLFVGTILSTITVALLTMSLQTIKAAMANPVKSLRSE